MEFFFFRQAKDGDRWRVAMETVTNLLYQRMLGIPCVAEQLLATGKEFG
jgi:hypothetical protein